ncbi:hypothetical protein CHU95_12300 [Niveispirillum lacus]|uniref:Aromatic-ring-hydroxylating dioxygenase alpha subunit C-terminal domain-containing protein n=1 Tax=Niveispirillum lacus TaxID=1981099 RepID=A0A255YZW5_9PROT|nr:RHO alpha subunit C-terminal catalytic domain-containing protein [Niveispirillum lacus]OYQ34224.1 hypothetical protein CHU95_12300 [Niveispirillum lacus]
MLNFDQAPPRHCLLPHRWFTDASAYVLEKGALARHLPWRYAGLAGDDVDGADLVSLGGFLFRQQVPDAPPLAEWLGPFAADLLARATALDSPVAQDAAVFAANWKILVENTLDDFHGPTVHPHTIHPAVHADWRQHLSTKRAGPHSRSSWKLADATAAWWQKLVARGGLRRFADQDRYDHVFIFPDLYVASFYGTMVIVHRVVPEAVDRSRLEWRTFLPSNGLVDAKSASFRRGLVAMLSAAARQVIEEDKPLCEQVQIARAAAIGPGILGWREQRIGDVHAMLTQLLERP